MVPVEIAAAAAGTRELRHFSLGRLSFRTGQGRSDQPPVHRAIVPAILGVVLLILMLVSGKRLLGVRHLFVFGRRLLDRRLRDDHFRRCGLLGGTFDRRLFPATRRWKASLLVFVIRVTCRAARLLHLIVDHRHDDVIGDAAFTRTVVVQNVTEPRPALLH
jgi:hypothetical protein